MSGKRPAPRVFLRSVSGTGRITAPCLFDGSNTLAVPRVVASASLTAGEDVKRDGVLGAPLCGDPSGAPVHVAVIVEAPHLQVHLGQPTVVTDPIGEQVAHPRGPHLAVVVGGRDAQYLGPSRVPVQALHDVRDAVFIGLVERGHPACAVGGRTSTGRLRSHPSPNPCASR